MTLSRFYLLMCIIGTVLPWLYFGPFFVAEGPDLVLFNSLLTVNPVTKGLTADICLSILVFWVWSYFDARHGSVRNWWLIIPSTVCVGLSLALPLYLFLKEGGLRSAK